MRVYYEVMMTVTRSDHSGHHSESSLGWSELPFVDSEGHDVQGSRQSSAKKSSAQRRQDKVSVTTRYLNCNITKTKVTRSLWLGVFIYKTIFNREFKENQECENITKAGKRQAPQLA